MEAVKVKKESGGIITIGIQIQEAAAGHQKLSFVTERCVPLRRVFLDFCDRLDLVYSTVTFRNCDGDKLNDNRTAEESEIEDGDVIDAFYSQLGGGSHPSCPYSFSCS